MKQTDEQKKFSKVFNRFFGIYGELERSVFWPSTVWLIVNTELECSRNRSLFDKLIDGIIFASLNIRSIKLDTSSLLTKYIRDIVDFIVNNFSEERARKLTSDEIGFIMSNVISDTVAGSKLTPIVYFDEMGDVIRSILDDGILYTDEEF